MAQHNQINIKTFFFTGDNKVIEKFKDGNVETREKESVIAEIRNIKLDKQIKDFEIIPTEGMNLFKIYLEEGMIELRLNSNDITNVFLKTILRSAKLARDEVTVVINGNQFHMQSKTEGKEKRGNDKDISYMLEVLKGMQNNNELENVEKTGKKNLRYTFETTENEKIKIIVAADNKEVVSKLDKFVNIYLKKKKLRNKLFAAIGVGVALAVTAPYVSKLAHTFVTEASDNMDLETTFNLLDSYALRLKSYNLSSEDYDKFRTLLSETIAYYETTGEYNEDYKTLLKYQELVDEHYTEMRGRSY